MLSTILELILKARDDASAKLKGLSGNVGGLFKSFTDLYTGALAAAKGVQMVADTVSQTIGEVVEYIKQVREMSQVTGLSSEETSRLVQVADDWGVSIEQLRTGLQMMVKNGVVPSVENLAALADEYKTTADRTAFAEKASKLLGKQWATLVPLLAKGGQALRDQAAAVDESLVVTQQQIQQTRDYELAVDNWGDAVLAAKVKLVTEYLPALTNVLTPAHKEIIGDQEFMVKQIGETTIAYKNQHGILVEVTTEYNNLKASMAGVDKAAKNEIATQPLDDLGAAAEEAAGQLDNIVVKLGDVGKATLAQKALDAVNQEFQKTGDLDAYRENVAKVGTLFSDVIPAGQLEANLALVNLERAYANGDVALDPYLTNLANFDKLLRGLPKFVDIYVRTHYSSTGEKPKTGGGGTGHDYGGSLQHGGSVEPGGMYEVTEGGKSELLSTPSGNFLLAGERGKVTPISKGGGDVYGGDININMNIVAPVGASADAIATLAAKKVIYALSNLKQMHYAG